MLLPKMYYKKVIQCGSPEERNLFKSGNKLRDNVDKNETLTAFVILWLEFIPVHTEPPRPLQTPITTDLQKHTEHNKSVETSHISQSTKACRPHSPINTSRAVSYGGICATLTHFKIRRGQFRVEKREQVALLILSSGDS